MPKLLIMGAAYGKADVTAQVRRMVRNDALSFTVGNAIFGDSWPNVPKSFVCVYRYADQAPRRLIVREGQNATVAYSGSPEAWSPVEGALNVLGAAYGLADVRAPMAGRVKDNRLNVPSDNATWTDGWPGVPKTLVAVTSYGSAAPVTTIAQEQQTLSVGPRVLKARGPILRVGETLTTGQYLASPSGYFFAIQQFDGNLVVYRGSGPDDNRGGWWNTGATGALGDYFLAMQPDGNLCTYKGTPIENRGYLWGTQALAGGGSFFLYMQDDGNLCVYKGTDPLANQGLLWQSGKAEPSAGKAPKPAHQWFFATSDPWSAFDSGGDHDGTLRNVVRDPNGPPDLASILLDGTDGSLVSFGKEAGTFRRGDFTVAFWLNTRETISAFDLVGNRTASSHGNFLAVRMLGDATHGPAGRISAEVDQDGNGLNYVRVDSAVGGLNDGRWHHVSVVREGPRLSLYVDGVLSATATGAGVADINNGNDFRLGRSVVSAETRRFAPVGAFADLRVYYTAVKPEGLSLADLRAVIKAHAPILRFHPQEKYLPCSVEWYLARADLVKADGTRVQATVDNLPMTGTDDRAYQLVLRDVASRSGDLSTATAYVRAKPASVKGFTDVTFWFFYAYNGPGTAHVFPGIGDVSLDPFGEHNADWETITLRVDDHTKTPKRVYLSQHDSGEWVDDLSLFTRQNGRIVIYPSLNGHASYRAPGPNPTKRHHLSAPWPFPGDLADFYLRNDTAEGGHTLDCAAKNVLVSADYLGRDAPVEPRWLNYPNRWGQRIVYPAGQLDALLRAMGVGGWLIAPVMTWLLGVLPSEAKEEEGPTGPKMKGGWRGDPDA